MADGSREGASKLLRVLGGTVEARPPVWLMRQAGRYLPEYRAVRAAVPSFLDLCFSPELAAEVTLQPLRRFPLDAAIIFSDIMVIPLALGQPVRFVEGEGPKLEPIRDAEGLGRLSDRIDRARLEPVYEAIARVRAALPAQTALLGFCGAPWTLASYMVEGGGSPDQRSAKLWAYRDPGGFARLIDRLVDSCVDHLDAQFDAGADAVQIFDSWAGSLPAGLFEALCVRPIAAITRKLYRRRPDGRIIVFPRGAGTRLAGFAGSVLADAIGLDTAEDRIAALAGIARNIAVQGNIDPLLLVAGGDGLDREVDSVLRDFAGRPAIVNLGHGVRPETPPEHVARLVARVQGTAGPGE